MAIDTLNKLRNLLSMKSTLLAVTAEDLQLAKDLIEALRADLAHAVRLIQAKDKEIQSLCEEIHKLRMAEWAQIDSDEDWLFNYLAQQENENGYRKIDVRDMTPLEQRNHFRNELEKTPIEDEFDDEIPF